ncbi:MAG: ribosomal L7Ae/L30e/S12e/Gadd45 family protein [Oscillospiraceae bacterium]
MERLKNSNKVVGLKQSQKAVLRGNALIAYVAEDAVPWKVEPFVELCKNSNIEVVSVLSMKALAKACHVDVPTAVAVLVKE